MFLRFVGPKTTSRRFLMYRLLGEGEEVKSTDEMFYLAQNEWLPVVGCAGEEVESYWPPIRRKILDWDDAE
jgi:hypothetical protein